MFDFNVSRPPIWPEHLRPNNEGKIDKEEFAPWWARHSSELEHLHPLIAEQWVHRHWLYSEFAFLPLETLRWDLVEMTGEEILGTVRRELAGPLSPEFDYRAFQGRGGMDKHPTARALDQGTWDYPIITLATPSGWLSPDGEFPDARLVLVEGHQRHRYLNALHALDMPPAGPHKVFILHSPLVG